MMYRRCVRALLLAAVVVGALGAQAFAGGRRAAIVPFYGYAEPAFGYGYGYYYNPYVAPFPAYGILPPPYSTIRMYYGDDNRTPGIAGTTTNQLDYVPRMRASEFPAVPFQKPPVEAAPVDLKQRFQFEITVPTADAVVLVEGAKTTQTGLHRVYMTPPLVADKHYAYTVEVQWTDEAGARRTEKTSFDFLLGESTKRLHFPLKMTK